MHSNSPLVSVIVLNYNNAALTCDLLRSFRVHCNYPMVEMILVDNGSSKDPGPSCKQIFPDIQIINSKTNKGYAGGMNLGLEKAKGEYVLLLNNDLIFQSDIISPMLDVFEQYQDAGIVSPKIMDLNDPDKIEYAGYTYINAITGRNRAIGHGNIDTGNDKVTATAYCHGAAMMVARKALLKVGPMSEAYFLYYEEMDWSERFRNSGYQVYVQPFAKVYHVGAATTGDQSNLKMYYLSRNRIRFMKYNRKGWQYVAFLCYSVLISLPFITARLILSGRAQQVKPYWQGLSDGLINSTRTPEWLVEGVMGNG